MTSSIIDTTSYKTHTRGQRLILENTHRSTNITTIQTIKKQQNNNNNFHTIATQVDNNNWKDKEGVKNETHNTMEQQLNNISTI